MAVLTGEIKFTGNLGDLIAYRIKGSDKIIIRRKSVPPKHRLKTAAAYENTRRQNEEWKACVSACRLLNRHLFPLRHLADYNYTGTLTGLCKSIQKEDGIYPLGQRPVLFSQHYAKLEGFSLNREYTFESFVKHPLQYQIDKANGSAMLQWPEIIPGINLSNPAKQPLYRFVFVLGAIPDIIYNEERKMYQPSAGEELFPDVVYTDWYTGKQRMPAGAISLQLNQPGEFSAYTLALAIGIEFGIPVTNTEIRPVKRYGAAKVLKMG